MVLPKCNIAWCTSGQDMLHMFRKCGVLALLLTVSIVGTIEPGYIVFKLNTRHSYMGSAFELGAGKIKSFVMLVENGSS